MDCARRRVADGGRFRPGSVPRVRRRAPVTPEQAAAFTAANEVGGAVLTPEAVSTLVVGLVFAAGLVWYAWVVYRSYEAWGRERMTFFELGGKVLRATLVVMLLGWLVSS